MRESISCERDTITQGSAIVFRFLRLHPTVWGRGYHTPIGHGPGQSFPARFASFPGFFAMNIIVGRATRRLFPVRVFQTLHRTERVVLAIAAISSCHRNLLLGTATACSHPGLVPSSRLGSYPDPSTLRHCQTDQSTYNQQQGLLCCFLCCHCPDPSLGHCL